jgi:hypothetical protein
MKGRRRQGCPTRRWKELILIASSKRHKSRRDDDGNEDNDLRK